MSQNNYCAKGVNDYCENGLYGNSLMLFMNLINALYLKKCTFLKPNDFPKEISHNIENSDIFDYIVVGAGSAGSVVANRLSEDECVTVLVLEAGGYPPPDTQIPGLVGLNLGNPEYDWMYYTEKSDQSCLSFQNGSCIWNRGKVLGGSSSLNGMIYIRGNPADYDEWATINNDKIWEWKSVLQRFKKSENVQWSVLKQSNLHGTKGVLETTHYTINSPMHDLLISTYKELGYTFGEDAVPVGFFETLMTIDTHGRRESTAKAFLSYSGETSHPPPIRNNLRLSLNSYVTKVLIQNNVAIGVEVFIGGKLKRIYARREVVLSCGTINSPQTLMLSGIGPASELSKFNIEQKVDLPVGENLQDHLAVWGIPIQVDNKYIPSPTMEQELQTIFEYFNSGTGNLAQASSSNIFLFNDPYEHSLDKASIQWSIQPFTVNDTTLPVFLQKINFDPSQQEDILRTNVDHAFFGMCPILLRPKSRGYIKLASQDPFIRPLIIPNYLTERRDINVLLSGVHFVKSLLKTKSMQQANAKLFRIKLRNCDHLPFDTEPYWVCIMRNVGTTMYHPVGTCKMAPRYDRGVVNSRLKVYGINRLRVIDASIMPVITRGNTNAPTIMIGEMGAEFIKADNALIC